MQWEDEHGVSARDLVEAAILAPSSHNTQPWLFRVVPEGLELIADRTRALPVNDPDDRELVISCGAALFNLRVAAAARGLGVRVVTLPDADRHDADRPDLLARVRLDRGEGRGEDRSADRSADASPALADLATALSDRRTYRKTFAERPVGEEEVHALRAAAEAEGCSFLAVDDAGLEHRIAELVSEGDSTLWSNRSWRRELAAWMRPRRKGDGITVPTLAAPLVRLVIRTFDLGRFVAAKDRQLAEESPLLVVLGTDSDRAPDWIGAGQALERVLLTATRVGLQASYLNQPVQVPALRPELADATSLRFPQLILRLGYPEETPDPAPRRPVDDVLERVESA